MRTKIIFGAFVLVSLTNVVAQVIESADLNAYTKPVLMPLLIFYVYESSRGKVTMRILLLCLALLFSWLGDIAMMYAAQEMYFIVGIGLFLLAQLTYIIVLKKSSFQSVKFNALRVLPFALYAVALFKLLVPKAGDFTIPIVIYGIVISVMAGTSRLREGNTSQESFRLAMAGAVLFLISDSVLAINKFYSDIPYIGVWVMSTYIAAQYFLVQGVLKHVDD
ncbi:MAG: lysoplasmalogenase [Cyclobacteriaceae bacterium]